MLVWKINLVYICHVDARNLSKVCRKFEKKRAIEKNFSKNLTYLFFDFMTNCELFCFCLKKYINEKTKVLLKEARSRYFDRLGDENGLHLQKSL